MLRSLLLLIVVASQCSNANPDTALGLMRIVSAWTVGQIPLIGGLLGKIVGLFWPSGGGEPVTVQLMQKEMGKLKTDLSVQKLVTAQQKYAKAWKEFEETYPLLEHHPDSPALMNDIRREFGDAQEACNAIESHLETEKEQRKFLMPYASVSAHLCLLAYKEFVEKIHELYVDKSVAESILGKLQRQWVDDRDRFLELGEAMWAEWQQWRRSNIVLQKKTDCSGAAAVGIVGGGVSSCSQFYQLTDRVKGVSKTSRSKSPLAKLQKEWQEKEIADHRVMFEPMEGWNLQRYGPK